MIETEHKGIRIVWSENDDQWHCHETNYKSPSLKKVQQSVNRHDKKRREGATVKAHLFVYNGYAGEGEVVEWLGPNASGYGKGEIIVAVVKDGHRSNYSLKSIFMPSTAVSHSIHELKALDHRIMQLKEDQRAILKILGPMHATKDDLGGLYQLWREREDD